MKSQGFQVSSNPIEERKILELKQIFEHVYFES